MDVLTNIFKLVMERGPLAWGGLAVAAVEIFLAGQLGPSDPLSCRAGGSLDPHLLLPGQVHPCENALKAITGISAEVWMAAVMIGFLVLALFVWRNNKAS